MASEHNKGEVEVKAFRGFLELSGLPFNPPSMKSGYLQNPTFFVDAQLKVSLPAQGAISNATNVSPFWGLRFAYPPCIDCLRCGGKLREGLTMVALRVTHPTRTSNGATRGALLS